MNRKRILQSILHHKLVAIIRLKQQDQVAAVLESLVIGGIKVLEITTNTPGFEEEITKSRKRYPEILIGAGTITSPNLARMAVKAGAQFLVTPNTDLEIISTAHQYDIPVLMGAMTPTELNLAVRSGADIIKLFPAAPLGLDYFRAIKAPFDDVPFFVVGGIGLENLRDWMDAGAVGAGIGGALAKPVFNETDRGHSINTAKEFVKLVQNNQTRKSIAPA